jgi:hypothetical protein
VRSLKLCVPPRPCLTSRSEDAAARFLADFPLPALVDALTACAPGSEVRSAAAASCRRELTPALLRI